MQTWLQGLSGASILQGPGHPEGVGDLESSTVCWEMSPLSPHCPGRAGVEDRGIVGCRAQRTAVACMGMGSGWGLGQHSAAEQRLSIVCLSVWGQCGW